MSNKQRIAWIDIGKGLGIALVVIGHFLQDGNPLKIAIYTFHVPFFFLLSGLTFNTTSSSEQIIKNKYDTILKPYFFYVILSLPYYFFFESSFPSMNLVKRIFFIDGLTIWNDPLWFLPVLFIVEIIFSAFFIELKNSKLFLCITSALSWSGAFWIYQNNLQSFTFLGINKVLFLLPFFLIGIFLNNKKHIQKLQNFNVIKILSPLIFISSVLLSVFYNYNDNISYYGFDLNNYWITLILALIATLSLVFSLSYLKEPICFLTIIGKGSLLIMSTHYWGVLILKKILQLPVVSISLLGAILLLLIYYFVFRFMGKKYKNKG